jgi:hypothetical protein
MKCDFGALVLARTFASPCLGGEPKAKVVRIVMLIGFQILNQVKFMEKKSAKLVEGTINQSIAKD